MTWHDEDSPKPKLRGVLHYWAGMITLGASVMLLAMAPTTKGQLAAALHGGSLTLLFFVSATYHRFTWSNRVRAWLHRADHAAIFVLIAGSYSSAALLALPPSMGRAMLYTVWTGALVGVLQALFWMRAPKRLTLPLYLALGFAVLPFIKAIHFAYTLSQLALFWVGNVSYLVGTVIYGSEKPDLLPEVFGYHELFHVLTIVAGWSHFALCAVMVRGSG